MWAIDLTHTTHTRAQTGIQQVCRNLAREFREVRAVVPLVHDRYAGMWRPLDPLEESRLEPSPRAIPPAKRSSSWTLRQAVCGKWHGWLASSPDLPELEGLFCPEIFDPRRDSAIFESNLPKPLPRLAYFYDAIALKHPEWTPEATVQRFPSYMRRLADFDHVTCISRASEADLLEYWEASGINPKARTSTIPLGMRRVLMPDGAPGPASPTGEPVVLMVGTLEARKNHLALLQACEGLWEKGLVFKLKLAGMLNRETGTPAANLVESLRSKGRPVSWEGAVSNERLADLYREADVFAYPSLYEGFGLPVLEALAYGLPVLTTTAGALGELAMDGGCLPCDSSAEGIRSGLESLLEDPIVRNSLADEASRRPIRTMRDTASDLASLLQELAVSPSI
jgi:glycosyltransferase involved in cell wall biosynthesis